MTFAWNSLLLKCEWRGEAARLHDCGQLLYGFRSSASDVFSEPVLAKEISDAKPTVALARIRDVVAGIDREAWAKRARTTAVLGNCPKTVASMRSGVAHWCSYIKITRGSEAEPCPVGMQDILGWSLAFRCIGLRSLGISPHV